jgi:ribosomal protein S27AE
MKKLLIIMLVLITASTGAFAQNKAGKVDKTAHTKLYSCTMHPDVVSHKPGTCPKCGMHLTLSSKEALKSDVTKNYTCPIHTDVVKHDAGNCPKCGRTLNLTAKEQMKAEAAKVYTCPMHPQVALTKDGVCPKCGKALVEKKKG